MWRSYCREGVRLRMAGSSRRLMRRQVPEVPSVVVGRWVRFSHGLWRALGRVAASKKFRELLPRKVHQLSSWQPTIAPGVWGSYDLHDILLINYSYSYNCDTLKFC